jgi:hypothetical protein
MRYQRGLMNAFWYDGYQKPTVNRGKDSVQKFIFLTGHRCGTEESGGFHRFKRNRTRHYVTALQSPGCHPSQGLYQYPDRSYIKTEQRYALRSRQISRLFNVI